MNQPLEHGENDMFATLVGVVVLLLALVDVFEAMVLPRRVTRRWRPTRLFYRTTLCSGCRRSNRRGNE